MALAEAIENVEDPTIKAKLQAQIDRVQRDRIEAEVAQQDHQRAVQAARTEAQKEADFIEEFTRKQTALDPDFNFAVFQRENAQRRQESAAYRERQARFARAAADRVVPVESMPRRKRRRRSTYLPPHIAYKDDATINAYERQAERGRGRYVVPVELLP